MAFYDHYAGRERNRFGENIKKNFIEKIFNIAINDICNSSSILEIGPGDGYVATLSKQKDCKYLGIEASTNVFNSLKEKGFNVVKAFVPPLPNNIGTFDLCFTLHVIEHLNTITESIYLIHEIRNKLNENGKIIIATPDYLRWEKDFYNCDYTHNLPFTLKRLFQLLINENFKIEYASYYVGNQFGILKSFIFWIGKLFYFRSIDNYLKNSMKSDIYYRAYLTCLPNIVIIAQKQ